MLDNSRLFTFLKDGVSGVSSFRLQMCLERLLSGGFVVLLTGLKVQTFTVSVTAHEGSMDLKT